MTNSSRDIYIVLLSYLAIIVSNIFLFREFWTAKNKEKMARQHNEYIQNFDSIITDIRTKQHDFKNHLTTLKTLCFTDKDTYEEYANSYIDSLTLQISGIDYLTNSSNKIIGSIIYSKSCVCNLKGIKFTFECQNQEIGFPLEDFELTSVLTNLIDNAIEAVESTILSEKIINVKIAQAVKEKYFQVSNTGNPIPPELASKLFSKGYTTKENKKSHGYGLYNVKKIISKYNGTISIIGNMPYVTFKVSFKR